MTSALPLSHFVSVRGRFVRSAHLERDFRAAPLSGYQLTECAYQVLKAVASAFDQPAQRAMTLTGPYGAGKSAFCLHLAHLLEQSAANADAATALQKQDAALQYSLSRHKLIPVLVVGSRQPLARALVIGLTRALEQGAYTNTLTRLHAEMGVVLESREPSARQVADLYRQAATLAKLDGAAGLLLIIDEMGKFFEYAAMSPKNGDIFTLQELGEAAARSNAPLLVLGVLHQNIEAYAQKLGRLHQSEWSKVSERFRQITFFPSDGERLELVGRALQHQPELRLTDGCEALSRRCVELDLVSAGTKARFIEKARAAYPLHPLTLLALPALFRRTGQSHRSMFGFLSGEEPHALGRFLRETSFDDHQPPLFLLDTLFNYAGEALVGGWGASPLARSWAEALEIIDRAINVSHDARRVLKCIALLGILRDPKIRATADTLQLALTDSIGCHPDVKQGLEELSERKLIVFSRTRRLYRLWEGGDVDVEEELSKAKTGLQIDPTLHVATQLCPPPRLIARRHSHRTGTLRTVQMQPCSAPQLQAAIENSGDQLTILLCLAATPEESEQASAKARAVVHAGLLIAVATETETLRDTAADVAAARRVEKETPELANDAAARRELAARCYEAETLFQTEWERLFGARESEAQWFYMQEPQVFSENRAFSAFLSFMADQSYPATPNLRNELINRRTLSGAAAAGRRSLIEAMLQNGNVARLGIKAAPPELSMYECVLRTTGLHQQRAGGEWVWEAPSDNVPANLRPAWDALARMLFTDPPTPQPVTTLYAALSAPPYGMTEGVLPILLCAFLLAHDGETTLYRQNIFVSEPTITDWEILLQRPELFSVAGCHVQGERALVVSRLAQGLKTEAKVVSIVRALLNMVRSLPEYAWKTRSLPSEVLALREAFGKARSPERLLFHDLPAAVGMTLTADEEVSTENVEVFFTALNVNIREWSEATPNVIASARDTLLDACGLLSGERGFVELQQQASTLESQVMHPTLLPFLRRAATPGDYKAVLDSVLAQVANRPPRSWTDTDAERFPALAHVIGALFQQAQEDKLEIAFQSSKEPLLQIPLLQEKEAQQCNQLVEQLKAHIGADVPLHIRRAALTALLKEIDGAPVK